MPRYISNNISINSAICRILSFVKTLAARNARLAGGDRPDDLKTGFVYSQGGMRCRVTKGQEWRGQDMVAVF